MITSFKWPARWRPLRYHPAQSQAWHDPTRFKTIHAGRRSGKTELFGKRRPVLWMLEQIQTPPAWDDPRIFIAAPTRTQVRDIYWNDLKALTPPEWIKVVRETDLEITTHWNATVRLVGLDAPARMEGVSWDGGIVDEYANTKSGIFDANIRPAIADRQGWCHLIGVPDLVGPAQAEYRDMCKLGQSGENREWRDFCWGSQGVLPDSEIESMRSTMDPRLFQQETTGAFIVPGGLAFPDFSRDRHVAKCAYDPSLPLRWSLDFNVDPMCSVVCQQDAAGKVRVIKEFELPDTVARMAVQAFVIHANRERWKLDQVFVYGDPAGKQRSTAADSIDVTHWTQVYNAMRENGVRFTQMQRTGTVPIAATVASVNGLLLNAAGESRLTIDPSCRSLIKGLEGALAQTKMDEFHTLAAFRYYAERQFPVRSVGASSALTYAVA